MEKRINIEIIITVPDELTKSVDSRKLEIDLSNALVPELQLGPQARRSSPKKINTRCILRDTGHWVAGRTVLFRGSLPTGIKFDEHDDRYWAEISSYVDATKVLRWKHDNKFYSVSQLTHKIMQSVAPNVPEYTGNAYKLWTDFGGNNLRELAKIEYANNIR